MILKEDVLAIVKNIPKGKVTTYKAIGDKLGTKGYRAIGQILKNNLKPVEIPCHRVIRSDRKIGGYFGINTEDKIKLLVSEGIKIDYEENCCRVAADWIMYKFDNNIFK